MNLTTVSNASLSSWRVAPSISLYISALPKTNTDNPFNIFSRSFLTFSRSSLPDVVLSIRDRYCIPLQIVAIVGGLTLYAFPPRTTTLKSSPRTASATKLAPLFMSRKKIRIKQKRGRTENTAVPVPIRHITFNPSRIFLPRQTNTLKLLSWMISAGWRTSTNQRPHPWKPHDPQDSP